MGKVITFSLDSSSVGMAVNEMEQYIDEVRKMLRELAERLATEGVSIASMQVASMGAVDTGELQSSFVGFYDEHSHVGVLRANCLYAVFVEYGTGIVGAYGPKHPPFDPEIDASWQHDASGHGENGWYYIDDKDGKRHWTRGMPSRPFFYETYKELQVLAKSLAAEIFNR